jgi:hypothetical protein
MSNWSRDHRHGAGRILARIERIEGEPHVTVVGSDQPPGITAYMRGADDDTAKAHADQIVRQDFDHPSCQAGCGSWREEPAR